MSEENTNQGPKAVDLDAPINETAETAVETPVKAPAAEAPQEEKPVTEEKADDQGGALSQALESLGDAAPAAEPPKPQEEAAGQEEGAKGIDLHIRPEMVGSKIDTLRFINEVATAEIYNHLQEVLKDAPRVRMSSPSEAVLEDVSAGTEKCMDILLADKWLTDYCKERNSYVSGVEYHYEKGYEVIIQVKEENELPETPPPKPAAAPSPVPGTDPVLEEMARQKGTAPKKRDNSPADLMFNQVLLGKREDLLADMEKHYPDGSVTEEVTSDPTSLFSRVVDASVRGWNTGKANTMATALANNNKVGDRLVEQNKSGIERLSDGRPMTGHHTDQKVSGKQAKLLLMARLGNLYRVNLLNSGFWVALRAPKLTQLNDLFTMMDLEGREIGRTIGAHYALVSDMYLKKKFVELLISQKIIIESNFKDIFEKGAFVRNLSYHDYDVLMHGVVTLMSKAGLRSRLVCPKCGKVSSDFTLDVSACKFVNLDLLKMHSSDPSVPSVIEWWQQPGRAANGAPALRTEADLKFYREKVLGDHVRRVTQEIDNSVEKCKFDLIFKNPTMNRYFTVGQTLIDQLNNTITSIAQGDTDKDELVRTALTVQGFQLVAPWISELIVYKPDGKTVDWTTDDVDAIMDFLDTTVQEGQTKDLFDELNKFTVSTRFNYIGSFQIECPQCHAKPESDLDNFFPLDVETIFFGLLFRLSRAE